MENGGVWTKRPKQGSGSDPNWWVSYSPLSPPGDRGYYHIIGDMVEPTPKGKYFVWSAGSSYFKVILANNSSEAREQYLKARKGLGINLDVVFVTSAADVIGYRRRSEWEVIDVL